MATTAFNAATPGRDRDAIDAIRWPMMIFGVLMIVLGVFAIAAPAVATIAVDIYIGWLFLVSGIAGLVTMFFARTLPGFLWTLLSALLAVVAGIVLIWNPVAGAVSLTIVLTALFVGEGIAQLAASISYRELFPGTWGWMLASGLADLLLAAVIMYGWPQSATWAIGLLVGVNLITSGLALFIPGLALATVSHRAR